MNCVIEKVNDRAIIPKRATVGSAGYDLCCYEKIIVHHSSVTLIKTGIKIQIPEGYYGRIAPRSSLSIKGLHVGAGVVDSDYRGEIIVVMHNLTNDIDLTFVPGDKIAQLIIEKCYYPEMIESEGGLQQTLRGDGGFGSTN